MPPTRQQGAWGLLPNIACVPHEQSSMGNDRPSLDRCDPPPILPTRIARPTTDAKSFPTWATLLRHKSMRDLYTITPSPQEPLPRRVVHGLQPASPACQAAVLHTTPIHPGGARPQASHGTHQSPCKARQPPCWRSVYRQWQLPAVAPTRVSRPLNPSIGVAASAHAVLP